MLVLRAVAMVDTLVLTAAAVVDAWTRVVEWLATMPLREATDVSTAPMVVLRARILL
jgi:hypothetical protein